MLLFCEIRDSETDTAVVAPVETDRDMWLLKAVLGTGMDAWLLQAAGTAVLG